jgi:hypothetical protein
LAISWWKSTGNSSFLLPICNLPTWSDARSTRPAPAWPGLSRCKGLGSPDRLLPACSIELRRPAAVWWLMADRVCWVISLALSGGSPVATVMAAVRGKGRACLGRRRRRVWLPEPDLLVMGR